MLAQLQRPSAILMNNSTTGRRSRMWCKVLDVQTLESMSLMMQWGRNPAGTIAGCGAASATRSSSRVGYASSRNAHLRYLECLRTVIDDISASRYIISIELVVVAAILSEAKLLLPGASC
jgi:hypothetical protein